MAANAASIIQGWPQESREAAKLVIETYGEPQECTPSTLVWSDAGPWKRVVASSTFYNHEFPIPHIDSVQSFIDYKVPSEMLTELGQFDGSVIVDRTAGEVSARCHDEQANFLALNLMNDIVTGVRTAAEARQYYAEEFLNVRRKQPTPYMERLRFVSGGDTVDRDSRALSDGDLQSAAQEGKRTER